MIFEIDPKIESRLYYSLLINQFSLIIGINLMDIRPSIIAAAAVLAVSDGQLTRKTMELKMSVISFWGSQDNVSFLLEIVHLILVHSKSISYWPSIEEHYKRFL